jgi:hypothetical protein
MAGIMAVAAFVALRGLRHDVQDESSQDRQTTEAFTGQAPVFGKHALRFEAVQPPDQLG